MKKLLVLAVMALAAKAGDWEVACADWDRADGDARRAYLGAAADGAQNALLLMASEVTDLKEYKDQKKFKEAMDKVYWKMYAEYFGDGHLSFPQIQKGVNEICAEADYAKLPMIY